MSDEINLRISLLFNRLLWPSAIVRDRACAAIAKLLLDRENSSGILSKYLRWIHDLQLESLCANALLPIVLANDSKKALDLPDQDVFVNSLPFPSVLSAVLMNELWPTTNMPNFSKFHSGDAPNDFRRSDFFDEFVEAFLPPVYRSIFIEELKRQYTIDLTNQWAFEWEKLIERTGKVPSDSPLRYWLGTRATEPRHSCMDTEMSEIYRSAFLRALAWAVDSGCMPASAAFEQSALACPIDIDLSKVSQKPKPQWWPQASSSKSKIDTSVAGIWEQVEEMWNLNTQGLVGLDGNGDSHILVTASGLVGDDATVYDLEIHGAFQKSDGARAPDAESVFQFLQRNAKTVAVRKKSSVRITGNYKQNQLQRMLPSIRDWSFVPATSNLFIQPRWQFWRLRRGISVPSPIYSLSDVTICCNDSGILTNDRSGQIISRWSDWADGLCEERVLELPMCTGQMLTINQNVVQQFAEETSSNFCWVVQLSGFTRSQIYEEYEKFSEYSLFGASIIIRP